MMLPPFEPKCFTASLIVRIVPSTLVLNSPVKLVLGDLFDRGKLIDAGIVHQHVERAEGLCGVVEQPLHVGRFGDIALQRDGFTALGGNFGNDPLGAILAGRIIHHHCCACGTQAFGDAGPDTLRRTGDDSYFAL